MIARDEVAAAPQTSVNAAIGAHRRFTVVDAGLERSRRSSAHWAARSTTSS